MSCVKTVAVWDVDCGGRKKTLLEGSRSPHLQGQFWGQKADCPRTCPTVDILKSETQQGAEPVRCRCWLGCTRSGAHWRKLHNLVNTTCGGDAALCQMTLTTCFVSYSTYCLCFINSFDL